jgi:vacuolar protein-sorting-associated protein 4
LTPCSPGDSDAIEKAWTEVEGDQLLEPDLTVNDFIKAVSTCRPTVNQADLEMQVKFTNEFGQEG